MISVGIDLGDRSLATSAVELDEEGIPLRVRALSLLLHDGGVIDEQYKVSRIAKRGQARRTRKRFDRKRRRPEDLKKVLLEHGFPAPENSELPPRPSEEIAGILENSVVADRLNDGQFPYFARRALLTKIDDQAQARLLFSCAVMHIDRHRGWRNPWQSIDSMLRSMRAEDDSITRTQGANRWLLAVSERFSTEVVTYGQAGAFAIERGKAVRPNDRILKSIGSDISKAHAATKKARSAHDLMPLVSKFVTPIRPYQQDLAFEIMLMADTQGFDPEAVEAIMKVVFWQEKPGFAVDVIGDCPLVTDPQAKRAASYLPSVQEWKIRGFIATLRATDEAEGAEKRRLSQEESEHLFEKLSTAKDRSKVRWRTLEDWLAELADSKIRLNRNKRSDGSAASGAEDEDESSIEASRHPLIDNINSLVLRDGSKWKTLRDWWVKASRDDRELLLRSFDAATGIDPEAQQKAFAFRDGLLEDGAFDAEEFENFMEKLPDGRVAYSSSAIDKMLPFMRGGADLYEARKQAFGLDETWTPPGIKWDEPRMNHPVLQVVRSGLNKSLTAIDNEIGVADFVRVEAARRSMSIKYEKRSHSNYAKENEARNATARQNIIDHGENPSRGRIRVARIIADQNCQCAYGIACAGKTTLSLDNTELDHIIPRAEGAGSPRKNMVAICNDCNRKKGGRPFAAFATEDQLEETVERMRAWQLDTFSPDLPRDMERILRAKSAGDVDLRSATPTSQVATQICNMLQNRYEHLGNDTKCEAVNAAVAAEARKSAEFRKSRTDHRHHVMDATIVACINPKVIPFLRERQAIRDYARTYPEGNEGRKRLKEKANAFGLETDYFNRWMAGLRTVVNEVVELLERDGEPVVSNGNGPGDPIASLDVVAPRRPIRLKAASRNKEDVLIAADPLHEQTAVAVEYKALGDAWTKDEIYRVADRDLHVQLRRAARESKNKLSEDPDRVGIGENGEIAADELVTLTPRIPQVLVRGAAYAIGSVHHLRVYEFDNGSGPKRAFLPVYHFDVVQALREESDAKAERRATHVELHPGSVTFRVLGSGSFGTKNATALLAHLDNGGSAKVVGWIAAGDEILLDSPDVKSDDGPAEWADAVRMYCTKFGNAQKMGVRPLILAEDDSDGSAKTPRVSLSTGMSKITVIRRDTLGRIKLAWRPDV
jgi:CRISPR-associated endonuclease Csn1